MSVPPSLYHHHPKQPCEEVEAIVSRHSLQFRSQGGDVGGCFHGGSSSAAGNWPDGTFGGGIAENGSIRPAHTRRRKPRDLEIQNFAVGINLRWLDAASPIPADRGREANHVSELLRRSSPGRNFVCGDVLPIAAGRADAGDFLPAGVRCQFNHGGLSPRCEASARANFHPRFARARHYFQPADEPFEILVKPVPRFAHTTAPISRRNGHSRQAPSAASTGSRSSLVFVENKHGARPWVIASPRRGQS